MRKFFKMLFVVFGISFITCGCVSKNDKNNYNTYIKAADSYIETYIKIKYNVEYKIVKEYVKNENQTGIIPSFLSPGYLPYVVYTININDKEFDAIIDVSDTNNINGVDNYQKDNILNDYKDYLNNSYGNVVGKIPDDIKINYFDNEDVYGNYFINKLYDGNILDFINSINSYTYLYYYDNYDISNIKENNINNNTVVISALNKEDAIKLETTNEINSFSSIDSLSSSIGYINEFAAKFEEKFVFVNLSKNVFDEFSYLKKDFKYNNVVSFNYDEFDTSNLDIISKKYVINEVIDGVYLYLNSSTYTNPKIYYTYQDDNGKNKTGKVVMDKTGNYYKGYLNTSNKLNVKFCFIK